jgi:PadR family transcriptional regulator PadR
LHGFLELCLLSALATEPDYGFGLAQRLTTAGFGDIPGGTLYPALLRLEQQGWVSTEWVASGSGPRRKYYHLTPAGREILRRDQLAWQGFRASLDALVGAAEGATTEAPEGAEAAEAQP